MAADSAVWREHGTPLVAGSDGGPLHGVRLAVKDVHAVEGHRLGAGNPEWLAEAQPQKAHSWAVRALLDAGADVMGIARSDEFAYSLDGTNAHYGTPPNPAAPGRVPGGSSSGPASAVALGEADAGLGSDTAGSIRVPSSYCGLYGLRPTHGLVPVTGMLPLAPSFDTVAWLARDAVTLARVGEVLLPAAPAEQQRPFHTALVAADLVALAEPEVRDAFGQAAAGLAERLDMRIEEVPTLGGDPAARAEAFATAQGAEVWECDGDWVSAHPGTLGPGVERRFARAASVTQEERAAAEDVVHRTARDLRAALPEDTVLLLPATCGQAPLTDEGTEHKDAGRQATFRLTCLASGAGLPCLVLPRMVVDGLPVGLAVIAGPGTDHALLELAVLSGA